MLKFQQYDVIIYDVRVDFEILFGMWKSFVISYPCTKFHNDITINDGITCIFHVFLFCVFLDRRQKFQYDDVINFMHICFGIWANTLMLYHCEKFGLLISPLTTKILPPPPNLNMSKAQSNRVNHFRCGQGNPFKISNT